MKFISVLALAACAVLVSAAPHHGGGNSGTSINTNDESNREVKITDKSNTEITDNSSTQITDNSSKNIKGNIQNQEENRVQVNKGLLAGLLANGLIGDINILGGPTTHNNKVQNAQNNN